MKNIVSLQEGLKITGVTLLTIGEARKLPKETMLNDDCWWLKSRGAGNDCVAGVYSCGSVSYNGFFAYLENAVRPALMIQNLNFSIFEIGDKFRFGEKEFEIISDTRALCTESVGCCAFRKDCLAESANNYQASDLKKFLKAWYEKTVEVHFFGCSKAVRKSDDDCFNRCGCEFFEVNQNEKEEKIYEEAVKTILTMLTQKDGSAKGQLLGN